MTIINFKNRSTAGFDEDALFTFAGGEQVLNFGRLTTTGDLAEGIFAAADDVTIRNFGRVETNGLGAVGILVLGDDARIENYGSVTTRGGHLDFEFFSEGILAIGDRFHIANYGIVRVEGEFSSGIVGVGNDGLVVNYGRVDCFSASGVLGAVGDNSRAINAGQLTTREADATALFAIGEDALALNLGRDRDRRSGKPCDARDVREYPGRECRRDQHLSQRLRGHAGHWRRSPASQFRNSSRRTGLFQRVWAAAPARRERPGLISRSSMPDESRPTATSASGCSWA